MESMTIVSLGEILWDIFPDREDLGGAPFNFAYHASRLGHRVLFVSAVGDDERGRRARERAAALGVGTSMIRTVSAAETGCVDVVLDAARQPAFTLRRPAAYDLLSLTDSELGQIAAAMPEWICFGTLAFVVPSALATLHRLLDACPRAKRFYDVNLRPGNWSEELVSELLPLADAVKLNESEAAELGLLLAHARAATVCITRAERGCSINQLDVPGYPVEVVDAVGAGDSFSAACLHGLSQGWPLAEVGDFSNRVGALVASRRGGTPMWHVDEARALLAPHRSR